VRSPRLAALLLLLAGGLFFLTCAVSAAEPATGSPPIDALLERSIAAGSLPTLKWPIFINYQAPILRFYDSWHFDLVWTDQNGPTPTALAIIDQFQHADLKGLRPTDYDADRWPHRIAHLQQLNSPPAINDRVDFDLAMTICLMRFISALHVGRVDPRSVNFKLDVDQKRYDLPVLIKRQFVNAQPAMVPQLINNVEPPFDGYWRLEKAAAVYIPIAEHYHGTPLPVPAKTVDEGGLYPGLPQMIDYLKVVGDLPPDAQVNINPPIYNGPVIGAVKSFQTRHGLKPDGRLGVATVLAMNVPLKNRVEQIRLALERWRWLPTSYAQPPIVVNIPEFMLRTYGPDNNAALRMRVVVGGSIKHRTPIFAANLTTVVFRPYWRVPFEIQRNELVPKISRDPLFLQTNRYEVVDAYGTLVTDTTVTSAQLARLRTGQLFIRQKPGPKNALGLVKFLFPNPYNVYMHDTPSIALFDKYRRDFSHGCIRVEDPVSLAQWILRNQPGWDRPTISAAMTDGPDNSPVTVVPAIPVMIIYGTARAGRDGKIYFFNDIYGYDAGLEKILARGYPYP
jgi:murein L,D-transpeptidase YcbB/YkuD